VPRSQPAPPPKGEPMMTSDGAATGRGIQVSA
jgi:hypothetical protein